MTDAKDFIDKVVQVSAATGLLANVGAMELAGQIVSVLYANPEHIPRFMAEGGELFIDGTFNIENGSLTYVAINGKVLSPSVIRGQKAVQQ